MDFLLTLTSVCGAIVTISGLLVSIYKIIKSLDDRFDTFDKRLNQHTFELNEALNKSGRKRDKEIDTLNNSITLFNNNITNQINELDKSYKRDRDEIQNEIKEDFLLTLKLAIMSPDLDKSEKIKYAEKYKELGGNGSVGRYLDQMLKEYNETHYHLKDDKDNNKK